MARNQLNYLPALAGAEQQTLCAGPAVQVTADAALLAAPPDAGVRQEVDLARAGQARQEAIRLADAGDLTTSADALASAAAPLEARAAQGDQDAREQLRTMRMQEAELRQYRCDAAMRKQMKYQSHQARSGKRPPT